MFLLDLCNLSALAGLQVYKFKLDLQPGGSTVQDAGEHQPYRKHL